MLVDTAFTPIASTSMSGLPVLAKLHVAPSSVDRYIPWLCVPAYSVAPPGWTPMLLMYSLPGMLPAPGVQVDPPSVLRKNP